MCLVPRGAEEGVDPRDRSGESATGGQQAGVVPAVQLADAHRRQAGRRGGVLARRTQDLHLHAPLHAVMRFGKSGRAAGAGEAGRAADGSRHARDLGGFERDSDHRWRLQFELRKTAAAEPRGCAKPAAVVIGEEALANAHGADSGDISPAGKSHRAGGVAGQARTDARAGQELVAARRRSGSWPTACSNGGRAQEERGARSSAG